MTKNGDKAVIYCGKCQVDTPHTYKSSTIGDISKTLFGNIQNMGSGWYCDNCGKKNVPQMNNEKEDWEEDY